MKYSVYIYKWIIKERIMSKHFGLHKECGFYIYDF